MTSTMTGTATPFLCRARSAMPSPSRLLHRRAPKNELALEFYRRIGAEPVTGGQFMTLPV
jgi:hypothetical protein